jgi:archaemetzincin
MMLLWGVALVLCAGLFALALLHRRRLRRRQLTADLVAQAQDNGWRLVRPEPPWLRVATPAAGLLAAGALLLLLTDEPAAGSMPAVQVVRTHGASGAGAQTKARPKSTQPAALRRAIKRLTPLHRPMGPIQPGDWLSQHKEPGQSFEQYLRSKPTTPTARRRAIYIQPIGPFGKQERRALELTARFMAAYFCLPVKVTRDLPLSLIPAGAQRKHPSWGMHQILSTHVLYRVLKPRLPADAVAYLGLTATDLWPGQGWNFVFGQASLSGRVGVWSTHRNGDPNKGAAEFSRYLLRTIKTATHETGHMLSIRHCTHHECNMCGSNSRSESDRRPLALCPQCLAKLSWAARCDPAARYRALARVCRSAGLTAQATRYEALLGVLK